MKYYAFGYQDQKESKIRKREKEGSLSLLGTTLAKQKENVTVKFTLIISNM